MARSKPTDTRPWRQGRSRPGGADAAEGRAAAAGQGTSASRKGGAKVGRLKKIRDQLGMIRQAYTLTRKNDPRLPWYLLITFVVVAAVVEVLGITSPTRTCRSHSR